MDLPDDHESEPGPNHPLGPPPLPTRSHHAVDGYHPNKVYGVTRRFSLATLMLMMAGASLLLAGMNALDVAPYISGTIILVCIATAVGQMLLFKGKDPRRASVVVGSVCGGAGPLLVWLVLGTGAAGLQYRPPLLALLLASAFFGVPLGAVAGYFAGCAVASVLLLMDLTESMFVRWRKAREPDDDDPWPPPKNPTKSLPPQEHPL
jgi:hypothetical protein